MDSYNNPFAMRASEKIISDDTFLDLLSSEPLQVLIAHCNDNKLWNNVSYFRSSPGGGKTTLLRMFTPDVLKRISPVKHKDFKQSLAKLGVLEQDVIKKIGVYLSIGRDYGYIEEEYEKKVEQRGVFFALLNVRIIIAVIRSIMSYLDLSVSELSLVKYSPNLLQEQMKGLDTPCTLSELINWASKREDEICNGLDNYVHDNSDTITDMSLYALEVMNPHWFYFNGKNFIDDFIFQFDDAHKFTASQSGYIREETIEHRIHQTLWIAQRFEALSVNEMLDNTDVPERDFNNIWLEGFTASSYKRNSAMMSMIAEKRSKYSLSEIQLFTSLHDYIQSSEFTPAFQKAIKKYREVITKDYELFLYAEWLKWIDCLDSIEQKAIYLRAFIIYYNRKKIKGEVNGLFPLAADTCEKMLDEFMSDAQILVYLENSIPLYYGPKMLIALSTNNVELFLSYSEKLFSQLLAKRIVSLRQIYLSASEQHKILCDVSTERYDRITNLPNGKAIRNFIENVVKFCKSETFKANFPYRFVSGFAVRQENSKEYPDKFWFRDSSNQNIAEIIRECVAYNILEIVPVIQGSVTKKWTVFYLSRWICAANNLAVNKGGWRAKSLKELKSWI